MARFTRINKVDNTYKPVSFDLTRQNELMYEQLKDEQKQLNDVAVNDANAKLKYAELLTKIAPEDYHKAEKMLDDYTYNRAKQIAGAKDRLSLSESLGTSSSFLSDTNFGLMMKDYEKKQAILKSEDEIKQRGFNPTVLNKSILNESRYDEQGNRKDLTIIGADGKPQKATLDDVRVERVFDYATAKSDLLDKLVKDNVFSNTYKDPQTGMFITEQVSLKDKPRLKRAAEASASNYIQSTEGRAELSQLMSTDGKRPPLTRDEAIAEITRSYVAIALQKAEEKHHEIARNPPKGSSSGSGSSETFNQTPVMIPISSTPLERSNNARWLSDKNLGVSSFLQSSYKTDDKEKMIEISVGTDFTGASPSGNEIWFSQDNGLVKKPAVVKGVSNGYFVNGFITKVTDRNGKVIPFDNIGQMATFGEHGNTGIKNKQPQYLTNEKGEKYYLKDNGDKVFVKEGLVERFSYINEKGESGAAFKKIDDPVKSYLVAGDNYTVNRTIDVLPDNRLQVKMPSSEISKATGLYQAAIEQQINNNKDNPVIFRELLNRRDKVLRLQQFANNFNGLPLVGKNQNETKELQEFAYLLKEASEFYYKNTAETLRQQETFSKSPAGNSVYGYIKNEADNIAPKAE